jgi:4-aminobutyrate aminotransferase
VIEKEHLLENSAIVGNHILKRMADWPKKLKLVGDVRGRGLMIGVDIVKDKVTKEYGNTERDRIVEMAFERGVLFLGCGPSSVRICPPLIVTKEEADVAVDVLEGASAVAKARNRMARTHHGGTEPRRRSLVIWLLRDSVPPARLMLPVPVWEESGECWVKSLLIYFR